MFRIITDKPDRIIVLDGKNQSLSFESYMTDHKVVNRNSPSPQIYLQRGAVLLAQE